MSCSPSPVSVYPFVPSATSQWKIRTVAKRDNTAGALTQYYSVKFTSRSGAVQTTSSRNFLDSYDFQETFGTFYTESAFWSLVVEGRIEVIFGGGYMSTPQIANGDNGTEYGSVLQSYFGAIFSSTTDGTWFPTQWQYTASRPSNWRGYLGFDIVSTSFASSQSGSILFYLQPTLIYDAGYPSNTFQGQIWRQSSTQASQLVSQFDLDPNVKTIAITNTFVSLRNYAYTLKIVEVTPLGALITGRFNDVAITSKMGASLLTYRMSGLESTTYPIQVAGSQSGASINISSVMTGTNEASPNNAAQTYPYIRFGVNVFTTGSFPSHSFTVFAGESQTTYYYTLIKNAEIVQGANIPFRTNGSLQTSTNFTVESVRTMFNSNFPIVISPYLTGDNPRFSTTFMPVKSYESLANFVTLAENTPNVVLTNVLHSYTLANSLDASLSNQTVQLNMYMEYVTEPVIPIPPTPVVTYGPNLVGGTQLIQESAIEEGKEIIQNVERNLTAKQTNDVEGFKYMYAEYYMPEDVELVNRAKRDIHNFLRSGDTQNSWRDASLNQFLGTFNSKSNPKQINTYPHLSNEHAQKKLQEYYPDAKSLMDLFDHPRGINRPYFESLRQEQLSFVPGQVSFWDKVANSIGSSIGISSRNQMHQFAIASDTTGDSWSNLTKAYFKYGTFYEPFNKSQSLMRMNIYQPMGTKQPLYIPEIDDANYDNEGLARRAYDAIADFFTNERKQTILATTVAAKAFVNQRSTADLAKEQVKLLEKALGTYRGATILAAQDVITTVAGAVATDWLMQKGIVMVDDLIKTKALQSFFFTQPAYDRFVTQTPYRPIYRKPDYNSFSLSFIDNPVLNNYASRSLAPEPLALIGSTNSLALQQVPPVHEPLMQGVLQIIATEQDNPVVQTVLQSQNSPHLQGIQREAAVMAIETLFHVEGREQANKADRESQFLAYQNINVDPLKYFDMPSSNPIDQMIDAFAVGVADSIKLANLTYYEGLPIAAQAAKIGLGSTVDIAQKMVQVGDNFVVDPAFDHVIRPAVFYSLNGLWDLIKWGGPELMYAAGRTVRDTTKAVYNAAAEYIEKESAYNKANNLGFLRVVEDISNATKSIVNKTNYVPQDASVREAMRNVSEEVQAAKFNKTYSSIYNATDPGQIYVKIIDGTIRVLKVGDRKNIAKGIRSDNTTTIEELSRLGSKVKDSISFELNKVAPAAFAGVNYLKGITSTDFYRQTTDFVKNKLGISTEKPKRKVVLYKPKNQFSLSDLGLGDNDAQQFYNPPIPPSIPVQRQIQEILPTDPPEQIDRVPLLTPPSPQNPAQNLVQYAKQHPVITAAGGALLTAVSWKLYFAAGVIGKPIPDVIATTNSDVTATESGRQRNIHALQAILSTSYDNIKVNRDMEKSVRQGMGMEMSHFALRQRLKNNMHGYFHFKVLKALADPETTDEIELSRALKRFLSVKSISNSAWQEDIKNNEDSSFKFLMEALGKAPLLHNFIERITHQYSGSHKESSLGGMYIMQRARAPYELPEYKGVRPLAQTFIKKRDQKRK